MRIAVIGAGVAGLTLAKAGVDQGNEVYVYEKSRSVGGRLANKRLAWGNVDFGAQYFTARDPRFKAQVDEWLQASIVKRWPFTPHAVKGAALHSSPDDTARYIGIPSMTAIAHNLAEGLNIHFNTTVLNVFKNSNTGHWELQLDGGDSHKGFDWVVLALPSAQARQLLREHSLYHEIPASNLAPCWAVALATTGYVDNAIQGFFGDNTISWVSRLNDRQPTSNNDYDDLWMLHFSQQWSERQGKNTTQNISQTGLSWLSHTLQAPLSLVHSQQHFWRYAKYTGNIAPHKNYTDRKNGLAVIGDWCNGGRVEGAYLSAIDASKAIFTKTQQ